MESVIHSTIEFVKETLKNAEGGHDWFHIERVWKLSKSISKSESCNQLVVELAALLHDIADSKFHDGDETVGPQKAKSFLQSIGVSDQTIESVVYILENISFKGGNKKIDNPSIELQIVQDADRLDAIGAIGIARTFNYGGFKNRKIYDPSIAPVMNMDAETYKKSEAPTINHFYEKLLLLKERMNTETGRMLALKRHEFMEQFLETFYLEWEGKQ